MCWRNTVHKKGGSDASARMPSRRAESRSALIARQAGRRKTERSITRHLRRTNGPCGRDKRANATNLRVRFFCRSATVPASAHLKGPVCARGPVGSGRRGGHASGREEYRTLSFSSNAWRLYCIMERSSIQNSGICSNINVLDNFIGAANILAGYVEISRARCGVIRQLRFSGAVSVWIESLKSNRRHPFYAAARTMRATQLAARKMGCPDKPGNDDFYVNNFKPKWLWSSNPKLSWPANAGHPGDTLRRCPKLSTANSTVTEHCLNWVARIRGP